MKKIIIKAAVAAMIARMLFFEIIAYADKKEVTIWSWFITSTMEKSIEAFEKKHPDIDVKYTYYNYSPEYITALKAASTSGSLPDIIGLQPGALTQQYKKDLTALNDIASKEWGENWTDKIFPINLKQMTMGNSVGDDNYYILPQESQVIAIWYNRKIFEKLNLSVPTTYQELAKNVQILSKNGYIPLYQGAADGWHNVNMFLMIANQYEAGIVEKAQAGEVSWTTPNLAKAMNGFKTLFDDNIFQKGALGAHAYPTGAQLFAQGKVGMMPLGSWWMQESKFPPPLSEYVKNMDGFDYFYLPPLSDEANVTPPIGGIDIGYGLTKNGKNNPEAWIFLSSLINGEALQPALNDLNDLPAFQGHSPKGDISNHTLELYNRLMSDLNVAENQRIASPRISEALENALAAVASGDMSSEKALEKIEETQID